MRGIFICADDINKWPIGEIDGDLGELGITDVFVFSGGYDNRLKEITDKMHSSGRKVHLCFDCFSGGRNEDVGRWDEIFYEVKNAYEKYGIDGVNLDAIRYWQPDGLMNWIKFFLGDWNKRCEVIISFLNHFKNKAKLFDLKLLISASTKAEWNYKPQWLSRMYGQDYKKMSGYIDFFTPMTYTEIYRAFPLNNNYNVYDVTEKLVKESGRPCHPCIQAYYNPEEVNALGRMRTWDEISFELFDSIGWVLFLYNDMKNAKIFNYTNL